MKNALSYYYNLNPTDIHQTNGMYKFKYNEEFYTLIKTYYSIEELEAIYNISVDVKNRGIYCHQIIFNNQNNIVTYINENNYILLKTYGEMSDLVNLQHILYFTEKTKNITMQKLLRRDNWYELWTNKIDYFEYQVNQFGRKYPIIRESFGYFLGLAETGITMLVNEKINYKNLSVSHKRIKKNTTLFDLYNPLNFILDVEVRDACEYFKEMFKNDTDPFEEIKTYIENSNLTKDDIKLFYIRMYYPSFYFDKYEDIIENDDNEEELLDIMEKTDEYERLLNKIYYFLINYSELPFVEWIKKT